MGILMGVSLATATIATGQRKVFANLLPREECLCFDNYVVSA